MAQPPILGQNLGSVQFENQNRIHQFVTKFNVTQDLSIKALKSGIPWTEVRGLPKNHLGNPDPAWPSTQAYWEFDWKWEIGVNEGLKVRNVKIRNNARSLGSGSTEDVFKEISFHNVAINFAEKDGSKAHKRFFKLNPPVDSDSRLKFCTTGHLEQIVHEKREMRTGYTKLRWLEYGKKTMPRVQYSRISK